MTHFDITLIGGGIVGTACALELSKRYPKARILLLEKEKHFARHQTGHNSGVIHAGVYYQPGSLKADFCRRGALATMAFCRAHRLPFRQCGKLLVATSDLELARMDALEARCHLNQIPVQRITARSLGRMEPNIRGLGALFVPTTGITDFKKITATMAQVFEQKGGTLSLGLPVKEIREQENRIIINPGPDQVETRYLIACAGLHADRIARMMEIPIDFSIIPFRGEYFCLPPALSAIVRRLIYPIPDPDLPFLGVHLTPMIDGSVTVGPNAALGWKREGYGSLNFSPKDALDMVLFQGFWKVMARHLIPGLMEIKDSFHKPGYLRRIQKYCPSLRTADLMAFPAGIRAQAVLKDGTLVHDFLFAHTPRSLHVCNAPSPAATSAIPIAQYLSDQAAQKFRF